MRTEVAVVGGGAIGSLVAYALQRAGLMVTLLEPDKPGAAWRASAGMLAPHAEGLSGELLAWAEESLERYPALVRALEETSGVRVPLVLEGTWVVARSDAEAEALAPLEPLPAPLDRVRGARGGRQYPGGQVDPQALVHAARTALERLGGRILPAEARGYDAAVDGVRVYLEREVLRAEQLVLAAGAWSARFGLPVRPLRGEALLLAGRAPNTPAFVGEGYLLPRALGVYVGATSREGWGRSANLWGLRWLADYAHETFPWLETAPLREVYAGHRPAAERPWVGPVEPRVWAAVGHGRNGVLLAPATARILTQRILGPKPHPIP